MGGIIFPMLRLTTHGTQDSLALTEGQTYRSMDYNRELRNRQTSRNDLG